MNNKTTITVAVAAVIGLFVLVGPGIWRRFRDAPDIPAIASTGGVELDILASGEGAYYLQADRRWASDAVGGSGERLSAVGCTICSVAMAATHLGHNVTPQELNAKLITAGGYTDRGWLIWSKIHNATDGRIGVRVPSRMTHADLDDAIQSGAVPVVKFFLPGGIPHWVAIVGKSGQEYLVKDPLDSRKRISPLSNKTKKIVSVRYVEKS